MPNGDNDSSSEESNIWPNMFEEARDMLNCSLLMYPFAALREVARTRGLKCSSDQCSLALAELAQDQIESPIGASELRDIIVDILLERQKDAQGNFVNFETLKQSEVMDYETSDDAQTDLKALNDTALREARLHFFVDDYQKRELVFGIGTDEENKRITVCFRGSVGSLNPLNIILRKNPTRDWNMNLEIVAAKMETPDSLTELADNTPRSIKLHKGFHDYLFVKPEQEGEDSKYNEIVAEVRKLLRNPAYRDYKVYVSGHSLGAALGTLMAFKLATERDIPKPVSCVSFASPYVGDESFREAFQTLEKARHLRHLRVTNEKDLVPTMPPVFLPNWTSWLPTPCKHVGVHLSLKADGKKEQSGHDYDRKFEDVKFKPELSYPKADGGIGERIGRAAGNSAFANVSTQSLQAHSCVEYHKRLLLSESFFFTADAARSNLTDMRLYKLNDLYADDSFVGFEKKKDL